MLLFVAHLTKNIYACTSNWIGCTQNPLTPPSPKKNHQKHLVQVHHPSRLVSLGFKTFRSCEKKKHEFPRLFVGKTFGPGPEVHVWCQCYRAGDWNKSPRNTHDNPWAMWHREKPRPQGPPKIDTPPAVVFSDELIPGWGLTIVIHGVLAIPDRWPEINM